MADGTAIEWTEATWNPVTGCDRVSPGCANCYALDLAARLKRMGNGRYQNDGDPKSSGPGFGVTLHEDVLERPLKWKRPRRIFVNSMSDLFHEAVPDDFIDRVFATMVLAERHTFQVLTKRPERMRDYLTASLTEDRVVVAAWDLWHASGCDISAEMQIALGRGRPAHHWPSRNVWLGVSIENRRFVHRADLLGETPAAVRFISAEPLLGPLVPTPSPLSGTPKWRDGSMAAGLNLTGIDWLIAGGESGSGHRRIDPQWVRDLRNACLESQHRYSPAGDLDLGNWTGTRFFFKQWGGRTPKAGGRELDGRTWDEFPQLTSQRAA